MNRMLKIPRRVLDEVRSSVALSYPDEGCGLLVGRRAGDISYVEYMAATKNVYEGPRRTRYSIDPIEYLRIEEKALSEGREVVGIFHSHPDAPASPSQYDVEHAVPGLSYVILSVRLGEPREIKCWKLNDDNSSMVEQAIEII